MIRAAGGRGSLLLKVLEAQPWPPVNSGVRLFKCSPKSSGMGGWGGGRFSAAEESINMFSPRPLSEPVINGGREETERTSMSIPSPVFLNHTWAQEPSGHRSIPQARSLTSPGGGAAPIHNYDK